VQQLVLALADHGYEHLETFEVLHRSWHVTERSVRPDHRMVAHTGFVTVARRVAHPA
jgi:tRNA (adenine57-N1/adenine58-N1)-methyltransferase